MATLKGSTIAGTYDQLIKRQDSYSSAGNQIELMNDSGTLVTTALYLDDKAPEKASRTSNSFFNSSIVCVDIFQSCTLDNFNLSIK